MKRYPSPAVGWAGKIESWVPVLLAVCLLSCTAQAKKIAAITLAKEILDTAGVQGGIVVHLGCGDGRLTAALRVSNRYTIHGLEADPAKVAEARNYIRAQGIYGPVSVERFSGSVLPYTDNLINLIVVDYRGQKTEDRGQKTGDRLLTSELRGEVMRVLAPGGVACVLRKESPGQRNGKWKKFVKAWPDNIDQWTHFLHDASNNAVANDSVVGPPRSHSGGAIHWRLRGDPTTESSATALLLASCRK